MNPYRVDWHSIARDLLAEIWLAARNRRGVANAGNHIDRELVSAPQSKGRPVGDNIRRLVVPPLEVFYFVSEGRRQVQILYVRRTGMDRADSTSGNGNGSH